LGLLDQLLPLLQLPPPVIDQLPLCAYASFATPEPTTASAAARSIRRRISKFFIVSPAVDLTSWILLREAAFTHRFTQSNPCSSFEPACEVDPGGGRRQARHGKACPSAADRPTTFEHGAPMHRTH